MSPIWVVYYKTFKRESFLFQGKRYNYFYRNYNTTWNNERTVEVPIIYEFIKTFQGKRILEVGNVISHYFPVAHDIVDKYEVAEGVINQDIVDFHASIPYDLIVSISTLEHVGWDEERKDATKTLQAIENTKRYLSAGGKIVLTFPVGYNRDLDVILMRSQIHFTECYFMKRVSMDNRWLQVEWRDVQDAKYGDPFPEGNVIIIGVIAQGLIQLFL